MNARVATSRIRGGRRPRHRARPGSSRLGLILLAVTVVLLPKCAPRPSAWKLTAVHAEDRLTATAHGEVLRIEVWSPKGIGAGTFAGELPAATRCVVLRLHLRGLENLRFEYVRQPQRSQSVTGGVAVAVALASGDSSRVREELWTSGEAGMPIGADSPYWMPVRLCAADGRPAATPQPDGWIEVDAPRDYLAGRNRGFDVKWVDFYR